MSDYSNQVIELSDLPQVTEIPLQKLDSNYPTIVLIRSVFNQSIILIAFCVAYFTLTLPILLWPLVGILIALNIIWSYYASKACRYALREQDIIYQHGLWQRKTTAVSFNRIQHIDISNDPIERKYSTATIKLFTAGGSSADLKIAGLPQQRAAQIRQQIMTQLNDDQQSNTDNSQ